MTDGSGARLEAVVVGAADGAYRMGTASLTEPEKKPYRGLPCLMRSRLPWSSLLPRPHRGDAAGHAAECKVRGTLQSD
jgi:hypothetical protein